MIATLDIIETEDTPKVILDAENGLFQISGKSMPEDAKVFFAPIKEWISNYIKNPNPTTDFRCRIDYFNSSSAKKILEIFTLLEELENKQVNIKWYYEKGDRLMEVKGREYESLLEIPIQLIAE